MILFTSFSDLIPVRECQAEVEEVTSSKKEYTAYSCFIATRGSADTKKCLHICVSYFMALPQQTPLLSRFHQNTFKMDIYASCGPHMYTVQCETDWCVRTLMQAVKTTVGMKHGRISLHYDGELLQGSCPLGNTGLTDGSLVQIRYAETPHDVKTHVGAQKECRRLHIKIGRDAFVNAIAHRNLERIELLLATGEDLSGGYMQVALKTPLMVAVKHRHYDIAEMLLNRGFRADEVTYTWHSKYTGPTRQSKRSNVNALYFAVRNVDVEMVRLLLRHGALDGNASRHFVGPRAESPLVTLAGICGKKGVCDEDVLRLWDVLFPAWEQSCENSSIPCIHFGMYGRGHSGKSLAAFCAYAGKFVLLEHLVTKAYVAANPIVASSVLSACIYRSMARTAECSRYTAEVERLRSIGAAPCYVLQWKHIQRNRDRTNEVYQHVFQLPSITGFWLPFSKTSCDIVEGFDVATARIAVAEVPLEEDYIAEHEVRKSFARRR